LLVLLVGKGVLLLESADENWNGTGKGDRQIIILDIIPFPLAIRKTSKLGGLYIHLYQLSKADPASLIMDVPSSHKCKRSTTSLSLSLFFTKQFIPPKRKMAPHKNLWVEKSSKT